jgi:hypothetical protein
MPSQRRPTDQQRRQAAERLAAGGYLPPRRMGYVYLGAGVLTALVFTFILASPQAWPDQQTGLAMAGAGLLLCVLKLVSAYRILKRRP